MAKLEGQSTATDLPGHPAFHGDADEIGAFPAHPARTPCDPDEDRPVGGISVIPIPRREVARLQGTLRLNGLPRHKPTIVFGASRPPRDADDD
jgi:hypothetical protein